MVLLYLFQAALLLGMCQCATATALFAHFMVDNTAGWGVSSWQDEMSLAQSVHIDAFALNIAAGSSNNDEQIGNAFAAANNIGFHLFFSFDYAGNGAWPKSDVLSLLGKYKDNGAYFKRGYQPFVSTFEGPGSASDWHDIKSQTGCFFIPDWSSLGAQAALELEGGVADGLFSWAAWSWGGEKVNTYTDASYMQFLGDKPYMMPVSPWFYTNLPGYNKNWGWPDITMSMWADRWTQVLYSQIQTDFPAPEFVEIITWNDFGESHYIGPRRQSPPFTTGKSVYDYVSGDLSMDHDGWRALLSVWAQQFKTGTATITQELITTQYLLHRVGDCKDGGTTINTASQLQFEYAVGDVFGGTYISYTAVLGSEANVTVSVGSNARAGSWATTPPNGVGIYHGLVYVGDDSGAVTVSLNRDGATIAQLNGESIGGCTSDGYANMNPWVGLEAVGSVSAQTTPLSGLVCTSGTAKTSDTTGFPAMCSITCEYGYCPISACVCTSIGLQKDFPKWVGDTGYPKDDPNYTGLCSWLYGYGYTFDDYCSTTEQSPPVNPNNPFLPYTCTSGFSKGSVNADGIDELCEFGCQYGYCPNHLCRCSETGPLNTLPTAKNIQVSLATAWKDDNDLVNICNFACEYGDCPSPTCGHATCETGDRTYDSMYQFTGKYMDWAYMDPEDAAATGVRYITIVNMTPHKFVLTSSHSYQFDQFDWGDIPPGRARQNTVEYTGTVGKVPVDDNGEAYYSLEGTELKFEVRATTHIPDDYPFRTVFDLTGMGLGQREYLDPGQEVPVTLVITGSKDYGFITNIAWAAGNWMNGIKDVIKDRALKHVVMPGTHDSGMSKISGGLLSGGDSTNTQTQMLNIYDQLCAGARWFDLRVASIHPNLNHDAYTFYTAHVTNENAEVTLGATGEKLSEVIDETNKFLAQNPGEVIIFRIRYLVGIRETPSFGPIRWTEKIIQDFFSKLEQVNNRCPNVDKTLKFQNMPIGNFMDMNSGAGCVLFLLDTGNVPDGVSKSAEDKGIYDQGDRINYWDDWSNLGDTEAMANKEITDFQSIVRSPDTTIPNDYMHVCQWMVSTAFTTTNQYGIEALAVEPTNPSLYWAGVNAMSPEKWPSVIQIDDIGVVALGRTDWDQLSADLVTLAVGLNLYMISENCDISPNRSPLLPSLSGGKKKKSRIIMNSSTNSTMNTTISASPLTAPLTRHIKFANGTTLQNPSSNLHYGRVETLRKGTRFHNGTVLADDLPNPDWRRPY